jgi:hypothetical protein
MKTRMVCSGTLLLLAAASACSLDVGPQVREWFKAEMTSIPSPPLEYQGTGSTALAIILIEDGRLYYDLYLNNVEGARVATLHIGGDDENTPPISTLWTSAGAAGETGTGYVVRDDRLDAGELTGASYQQMLDAIRGGNAYVLLTSVNHPDGAFRAQIVPAV